LSPGRCTNRSDHASSLQLSDRAASFPAPCVFQPNRRWIFELPRISHPSAAPASRISGLPRISAPPYPPCDESPGRPRSCIFRLNRRWIFESPRISHPSAALALRISGLPRISAPPAPPPMRLWVTPNPASSGSAGDGSSSCPESRILQRRWPCESPGCPASPLLPPRLR